MSDKTVFQRIVDGEIPADIVFEDDHCIVIRDINPQAPVHLLLVPKKLIPNVDSLQPEDQALMGHLWLVVRQLAEHFRECNGGIGGSGPRGLQILLIHHRPKRLAPLLLPVMPIVEAWFREGRPAPGSRFRG